MIDAYKCIMETKPHISGKKLHTFLHLPDFPFKFLQKWYNIVTYCEKIPRITLIKTFSQKEWIFHRTDKTFMLLIIHRNKSAYRTLQTKSCFFLQQKLYNTIFNVLIKEFYNERRLIWGKFLPKKISRD